MKLTIKHKQLVILALLLVLLLIALIQGCGGTDSTKNCTAPDGSKITITPSDQSITTGGAVHPGFNNNWIVRVAYPDGSVMPKACITITGTFAFPNPLGLYQFYYFPNSTDNPNNIAVNSGFAAQSDDFGQYTFSTLMSAGSGTWNDTIFVQSGTNSGSATLSIK